MAVADSAPGPRRKRAHKSAASDTQRNTTRGLAAAGRSVDDAPAARADSQASGRERREPASGERRINSRIGVLVVVLLVVLLALAGRLFLVADHGFVRGRGGRGGRRRLLCLALDEVPRLLVEPRVHVVARLEDGGAAGAH